VDDLVLVERVEGEGWLVSIRGEHDLSTAPMLSKAFDPLFESGKFVVADIREVTFLDSQTLRIFASAVERAARQAARDPKERFALVVDVEQSHLRRLLDLARPIIGDVPTYPSRDAALEALRDRYQ
jgi:anti-anti-sigma factor